MHFKTTRFLVAFLVVELLIVSSSPRQIEAKVGASLLGDPVVESIVETSTRPTSFHPVGITFDKATESVIIADDGGNRIWSLKDGRLSVIAGPSIDAPDSALRPGFTEGDPTAARFRSPKAVAVAADGTIYVADAGNNCIRMIRGGTVSTFAGQPGHRGYTDGASVSKARFAYPRGIALRSDGTLFVADDKNGIRVVTSTSVSSMPMLTNAPRMATGVSIMEDSGGWLFYASPSGVGRIELSTYQTQGFETRLAGAGSVVAVSLDRAIVSVPARHAIYFTDLGTVRRLISGNNLRTLDVPGILRDGPVTDARFNRPEGLALDKQGRILVADSDNRQIRRAPAINLRWMIYDGGYVPPRLPGIYRISYVSDSVAFDEAMWDDSIEGRLEAYLNANASALKLPETARIDAIRFPQSHLAGQAQYIRELLGQGSVDLVIWNVDQDTFRDNYNDNFHTLPAMTPEFEKQFTSIINETVASLAENNTKLLIIDQPLGIAMGPGEDLALKNYQLYSQGPYEFGETMRTVNYGFDLLTEIERMISSTKATFFPTYDRYLKYEQGAHKPLAMPSDYHFSPNGNEFCADLLQEALSNLRPWAL